MRILAVKCPAEADRVTAASPLRKVLVLTTVVFQIGFLSATAFPQLVHAPPLYTSTRLKLFEVHFSYFPEALSETGIVGGRIRVSQTQVPFDVGVIWDREGNPSQLPVGIPYSRAVVIGFRPDGTPVGTVHEPVNAQGEVRHPAFWTGAGFVPLERGLGGRAFSGNGEIIVGATDQPSSTPGGSVRVPTLWWDNGTVQLLSNLQVPYAEAWDVSTSGTYVGITLDTSNPSDFNFGGFIGRDGTATRLNFPGFTETRAFEINDDGWFTGVWEPAFATQRGYVARYDLDTGEQEIHDLGIFPGYDETWAYAINNDRTIVGGAQRLGGDFDRALIWPNGSLVPLDLNQFVDIPEATLIDAYRINNAGQILAEARLHAGGFAYYVLTPVPEPAAAAGLAGAAIALSARRRGSRRG